MTNLYDQRYVQIIILSISFFLFLVFGLFDFKIKSKKKSYLGDKNLTLGKYVTHFMIYLTMIFFASVSTAILVSAANTLKYAGVSPYSAGAYAIRTISNNNFDFGLSTIVENAFFWVLEILMYLFVLKSWKQISLGNYSQLFLVFFNGVLLTLIKPIISSQIFEHELVRNLSWAWWIVGLIIYTFTSAAVLLSKNVGTIYHGIVAATTHLFGIRFWKIHIVFDLVLSVISLLIIGGVSDWNNLQNYFGITTIIEILLTGAIMNIILDLKPFGYRKFSEFKYAISLIDSWMYTETFVSKWNRLVWLNNEISNDKLNYLIYKILKKSVIVKKEKHDLVIWREQKLCLVYDRNSKAFSDIIPTNELNFWKHKHKVTKKRISDY